tara:strand:+ start:802 stop:1107 length:306 start_codon:yes stop_codon:yes gene_type:complete
MADDKEKSFMSSLIKGLKNKLPGNLTNKEIETIADKLIPNDEDLEKLSITELLASPMISNILMRNRSKRLKTLKDGGLVKKSKSKVAGKLAKRGYGKAMKG